MSSADMIETDSDEELENLTYQSSALFQSEEKSSKRRKRNSDWDLFENIWSLQYNSEIQSEDEGVCGYCYQNIPHKKQLRVIRSHLRCCEPFKEWIKVNSDKIPQWLMNKTNKKKLSNDEKLDEETVEFPAESDGQSNNINGDIDKVNHYDFENTCDISFAKSESTKRSRSSRRHSDWDLFENVWDPNSPSLPKSNTLDEGPCGHCARVVVFQKKSLRPVRNHLRNCEPFKEWLSNHQYRSPEWWDDNTKFNAKKFYIHSIKKVVAESKASNEDIAAFKNNIRADNNLIWVKLSSDIWWPSKLYLTENDCFSPILSNKVFSVILYVTNRIVPLSYDELDITFSISNKLTEFPDVDETVRSTYDYAIKLAMKEFPATFGFGTFGDENSMSILESSDAEVINATNQSDIILKRDGVLSWDDYFMYVAFLSALRSKDPSTQVGACIVNPDNRIVGIGYNGFPKGCSDDILPWNRQAENELDTKYPYVCHAEINSILNKNSSDVKKCRMYVALFPCNECAKVIIQSGIEEIIYLSDKYHDTLSMTASRRLFDLAKVKYRQHAPIKNELFLELKL